ncbi:MAG: ribonuclease Z [Bacteroidia bacterium]|nr:ribonuclease Z [Bacteroidia bacterium]
MSFEITILGSSSATPTLDRHPSSQIVTIYDRHFLIDCGEGTQVQMRKYKVKFAKINHIFISHLHGDHILGLPGFLASLHLMNRTNDIHLYCHEPLKEILEIQFKYSETYLRYNIIYHFLRNDVSEQIYEDEKLTIETIILNHRIPCCGFVFKEKTALLSIRKDKMEAYQILPQDIPPIKRGNDYISPSGQRIANKELTYPPRIPESYAYCSDTKYDERIFPQLKGVKLLYHEATFMHDLLKRANETYHTTAKQAAIVAKICKVQKLLIGHFSARYNDLNPLLEEARQEFKETYLAIEGESFMLDK